MPPAQAWNPGDGQYAGNGSGPNSARRVRPITRARRATGSGAAIPPLAAQIPGMLTADGDSPASAIRSDSSEGISEVPAAKIPAQPSAPVLG